MMWRNLLLKVGRVGASARLPLVSSSRNGSSVGFVGLGNMGGPMAENLLKKGHKVVVFDKVAGSVARLRDAGATAAESPAQVAEQCKSIVTMLPSTPHVRECYESAADGLLHHCGQDTLFIDCTTMDPAASKDIAALAEKKDSAYVDAPVSGGVMAAQGATLTFMVGAAKEKDFERAKVFLDCMGKNVFHCGPVSTGQAAKICNNMLLAISMIGVSEIMNLGMKLGLEPKKLAEIVNVSSGRCWSSDTYNPVAGVCPAAPANRDYQGGFRCDLMLKDLGLAQKAAMDQRASTPLGSHAHQLYSLMCRHGLDRLDFSSAFKFIADHPSKTNP